MTEAAYEGVENLEVMAEAVNYNRYLLSLIRRQLRPSQKVLDFGAGTGTFSVPLIAEGLNLLALEPDARLQAHLKSRGVPVVGKLDEVPDASIDLAYTFNVLEHIEDDRAAIRQLAAKLKPGARLIVYVPAFQILFSAMDRKVGHHRRYRMAGLVAKLREAGLTIRSARYADSLGFPATLLYRVIGDDKGEINRGALKLYDRVIFPISRALDQIAHPIVGKNLFVLAENP